MRQCCLALVVIAATAWAQTTNRLSFDVASVKVNTSGDRGGHRRVLPSGRFEASNVTLQSVIKYACDVEDFQLTNSPAWLNSRRYDIIATAGTKISDAQMTEMIVSLLSERFGFVAHRTPRTLAGYSLIVRPGKVIMKENMADAASSANSWPGGVSDKHVPMSVLADQLSAQLGLPVRDKTELMGRFDIDLHWGPDDSLEIATPPIATAIRQQLGLDLKPEKVVVDVLIIDHVEAEPTPN